MMDEWRAWLTALRSWTALPDAESPSRLGLPLNPLAGAALGAVGGLVYWASTQAWPTHIAVVLSMAAMAVVQPWHAVNGANTAATVFFLLIKYNALMALSAANLAFALPLNLSLGLIMICGNAASRAMLVSLVASRLQGSRTPVATADLGLALTLGFAPAALLGIPGLIGLTFTILVRLAFAAPFTREHATGVNQGLDIIAPCAEVAFYLGALAAWNYV
jgi:hypothetical protein